MYTYTGDAFYKRNLDPNHVNIACIILDLTLIRTQKKYITFAICISFFVLISILGLMYFGDDSIVATLCTVIIIASFICCFLAAVKYVVEEGDCNCDNNDFSGRCEGSCYSGS